MPAGDLLAFLRARLQEDQEIAEDVDDDEWRVDTVKGVTGNEFNQSTRQHLAHWCPSRVLREVEAKRRLMDLHERSHECSVYDHNGDVDNCHWCLDGEECSTLRLLAAVHSDHADYQAEWSP